MLLLALLGAAFALPPMSAAENQGYYRQPALHGDTLVFVAEGDLWKVAVTGGRATRLTSHPGDEGTPAISPDGRLVGFTATYDGATAIYTMPIDGGLPTRQTWANGSYRVSGWTPDGRLLYSTDTTATLPGPRLEVIDPRDGARTAVPLAEANDGSYDATGRTLYFTRLPFQGSHTKNYQGGTAQQVWRYTEGDPEAVPLTADYPGTSRSPMGWQGRVYFLSDRDGAMNLWSMAPDGTQLTPLTHHTAWDVQGPSMGEGRIAYQLGADLRIVDVATGRDTPISITLDSDFDQTREQWIAAPLDYLTAWHPSPDGERIVMTARGQLFVAPRKDGRLVDVTHNDGARWRDARFMPDGKSIVALSDRSGEVEVWSIAANGDGTATQLTKQGHVLRWSALPSPEGRYVAAPDKNQELWLVDTLRHTETRIDSSPVDQLTELAWSSDGRWLAYVAVADNLYRQIRLYDTRSGTITTLTTDRYDSYEPTWSPDGKWLYFLSDRNLVSSVGSPWGPMQPEPFFDHRTRVYQLALHADERSPFAPIDELHPAEASGDDKGEGAEADEPSDKKSGKKKGAGKKGADEEGKAAAPPKPVTIDLDGLSTRLWEVPAPPANRTDLSVTEDALYWVESDSDPDAKLRLMGLAIKRDHPEPVQLVEDVKGYELSADGKRLVVRKGSGFVVVDAAPTAPTLDKAGVDLSAWSLSVVPREEWRQMYTEAWRLERDYFWDPAMRGVDWPAVHEKYLPLVDRVRSRADLSDVLAQMISELSTLHMFVRGGDMRVGEDRVVDATLGASLTRDQARGGWRVDHIYRADPDNPARRSPLTALDVNVVEGDILTHINGVPALDAPDPAALLRNQAGRQVLLHVKPEAGPERDVVVLPLDPGQDADLRYLDWEYTRRLRVEQEGAGRIGYVHLRAMGANDYAEFARGFYPVFHREALIIDARHNRGGNIDSWLLSRLSRKAWFYWGQRVGRAPSWNMQYAFRGHLVVLCDQRTASDGEAFSEGVRRLGLGRVIGTRTWGGEIWLSSENVLVDKGIATAAEYGVYGPEGAWLIEGHGVEPDEVVDNLPHATYNGEDAQLDAALRYLQAEMARDPVTPPAEPPKPPLTPQRPIR